MHECAHNRAFGFLCPMAGIGLRLAASKPDRGQPMHLLTHIDSFAGRASRPVREAATIPAAASALLVMASVAAGFELDRRDDRLLIVDEAGKPAAAFTFGDPLVGRPAIRDLYAPGGIMVTRPCPIRPGIDPDDHATLHPGVMLCFSDLSGADPWRHKTAVRFLGFVDEPETTAGAVRFTFAADYLAEPKESPTATVVCHEESTVTIADRSVTGMEVRVVTWDARLTAAGKPVTFADVEEMGFGIRLVRELSPKWGGRYLAAHGGHDEKGIFGTQADWCDASGEVAGERVGVTLVDRGSDARRAFFHARDYGWLLANAFGRRSYTKGKSGEVTIPAGGQLNLQHALVLHGDVPDDALAALVAAAFTDPQ